MKRLQLLWLVLCSTTSLAANYLVTIDGKTLELDVGGSGQITLDNGQQLAVMLEQKQQQRFNAPMFSFEYPSALTPTRAQLKEGIHQTLLSSAHGSLVMVQEYQYLDPHRLVEFMSYQMSADERKADYHISEKPTEVILSDGTRLSGLEVNAISGDDHYRRVIVAYGNNDKGVLLVSQIDINSAPDEDQQMLTHFWQTLRLQR